MNKIRIEMAKREVINQLDYSSISGNIEGKFDMYSGESEIHIDMKYKTWKLLRKNGFLIWVEPIFKKTKARPDLLIFKDGIWKIVEILASETEKQLAEKIKKYPQEIEVIKVKDYGDIIISNFE